MAFDDPSLKQLAERPLWLPREMIKRGLQGTDLLTEHLPGQTYNDATVFILYHGTVSASDAVMERIRCREVAFSPSLRKAIDRWFEIKGFEHEELVKKGRNYAYHQAGLPCVKPRVVEVEDESGALIEVQTHTYGVRQVGPYNFPIFFGEWMMEVWHWWIGAINILHRMYLNEMKESGSLA